MIAIARLAGAVAAATVLVGGVAEAQKPNVQEHRLDQVQDRIHEANRQIDQEYRKGNFTREEARALELDEHSVNQRSR